MVMRTIVKRGWGHRFISAPFVVLHVMPNCCRLPATGRKSNKAFVFKDLDRIGTVAKTLRNPSRRTSAYRSLNCPGDCNRPFTRNLLWVQGVGSNPQGKKRPPGVTPGGLRERNAGNLEAELRSEVPHPRRLELRDTPASDE